jgi:hypothetical protein
MISHLESEASRLTGSGDKRASAWLKLGILAGASALAGGVAAAWWYRKTLTKLRQAENPTSNPEFKNLEGTGSDES